MEVRKNAGTREWRIVKTKDDSDDLSHAFTLEVLEVARHDDGEAVTSCVIVPDYSAPVRRPKMPAGAAQRLVFDALGQLLKASPHYGMAGTSATKCCVELEAVMPDLAAALVATPTDKRSYIARRTIQSMAAAGVIQSRDGWVWLP
ncbi:MAG: hypothetical protein U1F10_14165 [Burkholderiales bacterium]